MKKKSNHINLKTPFQKQYNQIKGYCKLTLKVTLITVILGKNLDREEGHKIMIVILIIITLFSPILLAEEVAVWRHNTWSIGMDFVPFSYNSLNNISFRKWKDERKGKQIVVSNNAGYVGFEERKLSSTETVTSWAANIPTIEYVFLRRRSIKNIENAYVYRGIGVSISGHYNWDFSYTYESLTVYMKFLMGIEHFFLKSLPSLSYSAEADFYLGPRVAYYGNYRLLQLNSGVDPRFFVHWYFE